MGYGHDQVREARPASQAFAQKNVRVARWSVITATTLALLKLSAVVITGSLSIAAALADSIMDIIASSVNFFAVRLAGQPAEEEHRYGHGKAEGMAGLAQGIIIQPHQLGKCEVSSLAQ